MFLNIASKMSEKLVSLLYNCVETRIIEVF
jgi:hypothetical protein